MRTTGLSESASDQVLNVLKERDYYIGIIILKREKDRELPIQSFPVILITSLFISFDFFFLDTMTTMTEVHFLGIFSFCLL